ncbi:hypothetical protein [Dissulfuribacter thermophilus]|nr:hypothetical protein [Dissulfuribacter thermophilus]
MYLAVQIPDVIDLTDYYLEINSAKDKVKTIFSDTPLSVNIYDEGELIDISHNKVIINTEENNFIKILPIIKVDRQDIGKDATLLMYIRPRNLDITIPLLKKTVTLNDTLEVDFLNQIFDPSDLKNMTFDIYIGYEVGGIIKYNGFVIVFS